MCKIMLLWLFVYFFVCLFVSVESHNHIKVEWLLRGMACMQEIVELEATSNGVVSDILRCNRDCQSQSQDWSKRGGGSTMKSFVNLPLPH